MSEDPITPIIGAIAGIGSAAAGLVSAFSKPDEPKAPQIGAGSKTETAARRRAAAAQGRSSTILTKQTLGSVGQV